jgi:hypothetical protein
MHIYKSIKTKMYRTVILPLILYGFEAWSITLLRVSENRMLRKIFGPKRDDVAVEWRRLHNEELYDLYFSPNVIRVIKSRRMRWPGHVARMGVRNAYMVLVERLERNRPLGRPRRRWEGNIKMDLQEV